MKPEKLEKLTCEYCSHLEEDEETNFYYCSIHKREIFNPLKAGCHHRDRVSIPSYSIHNST